MRNYASDSIRLFKKKSYRFSFMRLWSNVEYMYMINCCLLSQSISYL